KDLPKPHMEGVDIAGSCDSYDLSREEPLADLIGRLLIDWGPGRRTWIQWADSRDKPIIEVRTTFKEPAFPGFLEFAQPLSKLGALPVGWVTALRSSRGVYLLSCPRTKEKYVGAAFGDGGFWQRWQDYVQTGHGGNVALKSRDPSDYQVSILEVAGSAATLDDI